MYRASLYSFCYNQLTHKYILQNFLFIQCSLLHVSTSLCHPQGVSNMYLAKLLKFLILRLLKLQFFKIIGLKYYLVVAE